MGTSEYDRFVNYILVILINQYMNSSVNKTLVHGQAKLPYSSPFCKPFTIKTTLPIALSGEDDTQGDETNERMYYKGGAW